MNSEENYYCRFCAEPKTAEKIVNLNENEKMCEEIVVKLTFVNAIYVDVSSCDLLPKTICFVCYDSLNKAYDFLENVKRSQVLLSSLLVSEIEKKCDVSDDEHISSFDDFLVTEEPIEKTEAKSEVSRVVEISPINNSLDVDEKRESKEESDGSCNETLNVQDVINAAFQVPPNSNMTMYAKEVKGIKTSVTSWSTYPWVCRTCRTPFIDAEILRNHAKEVHRKCFAFSCGDCRYMKQAPFSAYLRHVSKHREWLRNFCFYCNAQIDSESMDMEEHMDQHFQESQLPCPLCGEILENEDALIDHLENYGVRQRKVRRKRGTPITVEDRTCKICKKVYQSLNSLRSHMKLHTSDRKRNYICDRCGKNFFNKSVLTDHIRAHDKIRPHACRLCNRSFPYPNMLKKHVNVHIGVKPYSCDQCGRRFRLKDHLKAHMIVHTDNMPYVCQYCSKAFRFKQILNNHVLQHTGSKPYSCEQCGMEFTNWSNFNKHSKRRHNLDTSKKRITPEGTFPINPETGQIIRFEESLPIEEWKRKVMIPAKRGKKKGYKNMT